MIDLTNKNIDEINGLIQKYKPLLELIKEQEQIPYLAYIFDIGIKYVREKYKNINVDWQQWSIVCLKDLQLNGKIEEETDIYKIIDDFIDYCQNNYDAYLNNIGIYVNVYYRDCGFVHAFINKKINI